jgi:hypothetical protein
VEIQFDAFEWFDENLGTICFFFAIFSFLGVYNGQISLTDKFTICLSALLTFVAIFYAIVIVKDVFSKVKQANDAEVKSLLNEVDILNKRETVNLQNKAYSENTEISQKKDGIYGELAKIRNRTLGKYLFVSTLTLIIALIVDLTFPASIWVFSNYKPYLSLLLFWIAVNNIVRLIILFYKIYL